MFDLRFCVLIFAFRDISGGCSSGGSDKCDAIRPWIANLGFDSERHVLLSRLKEVPLSPAAHLR
jgi:hypothetical protein